MKPVPGFEAFEFIKDLRLKKKFSRSYSGPELRLKRKRFKIPPRKTSRLYLTVRSITYKKIEVLKS